MIDRLTAMTAFVEVAKHGSFAPAARALGMSNSAISRHVLNLERWLDVELFHRTTRRLNLTDAGRSYLPRCNQIVSEVDNLERDINVSREKPEGEIRITAPVFMGRCLLAPLLPRFAEHFPEITLQFRLLDRVVNLVDEGFDLALRIGHLPDSSLVARKVGEMRLVLCASPKYLDTHAILSSVHDLKQHNCLVDVVPEHGHRWPFTVNKKRIRIPVKGNITVNGGEMVREMALASLGIAYLPDFFVKQDIAQNRLVALLHESTDFTAGIFLVYPQTRRLSSAVRVFIDHIVVHAAPNDQ